MSLETCWIRTVGLDRVAVKPLAGANGHNSYDYASVYGGKRPIPGRALAANLNGAGFGRGFFYYDFVCYGRAGATAFDYGRKIFSGFLPRGRCLQDYRIQCQQANWELGAQSKAIWSDYDLGTLSNCGRRSAGPSWTVPTEGPRPYQSSITLRTGRGAVQSIPGVAIAGGGVGGEQFMSAIIDTDAKGQRKKEHPLYGHRREKRFIRKMYEPATFRLSACPDNGQWLCGTTSANNIFNTDPAQDLNIPHESG